MSTENDPAFGQIVTFYSYKGGTGRSMALANVGYLLATDPTLGRKKVLMIDWDLEAPGLQRFFERDFVNRFGAPTQSHYAAGLNRHPGLIDYLEKVRQEYERQSPPEGVPARALWDSTAQKIFQDVKSQIPLRDYVLETDVPGLCLLKAGRGDEDGSKEPAYADTVRGFDWERFHTRFGSFLELWREELMGAYDYVLIDSRTGLTDTSGICTRVMPEKIVAVFVPNRQNIDGTLGVVRSAVSFRMQSRDPRALFAFPLASRIDAAASTLRTIWLRGGQLEGQTIVGYQKRFEDAFRELYGLDRCDLTAYFADTQVPHDSDYAYGERIAARVDTNDKLSIGHACRTFADYLVNYSSPWERGEQAPPKPSAAEPDAALTRAVKRRAWHELPRLLSLPTLIQIRDELRRDNLHDTEEPSLSRQRAAPGTRDRRTTDGTGNDLDFTTMGSAGRRFGRNVPLTSTFPDSAHLLVPNPRLVSRTLMTRDVFRPSMIVNLLAAAWIQFVVHPAFAHKRSTSQFIDIPLPAGDSWPERTIRVASTEPDPAPTGSSRPPAYASLRSQWWDASQIYGGDSTTAESLRTHAQGHLRLGRKDLLPVDPETGLHFSGFKRDWWVGLAMLHTLFTREHNYVCDQLASHNPSWNDEELFEKARLIVSALMMKIHITEWITAMVPNRTGAETFRANWRGLIGDELRDAMSFLNDAETFGGVVGSAADHYTAPYSLTEELASIYRMHPLLPDDLEFRSAATGFALGRCPFAEAAGRGAADIAGRMNSTDLLYSMGIANPGVIGLHNYPRFLQDLHTEDGQHIDLAAVDILRDRERGVPRYNEFLRLIRKEPAKSFDELTDNPVWRQEIKETYSNDLEKVDLMTGLYAEPLPEGFGFSETAYRILLLMTTRQIKSDRFFTTDYRPEVYSEFGFTHIRENTLGSTLQRHYPELQPLMSGIENAFHPWRRR